MKYALIPLGIDIDEEFTKEVKSKKRLGSLPDTKALARIGIDYDSI